jgi:Ca2+/Na+ antiporter
MGSVLGVPVYNVMYMYVASYIYYSVIVNLALSVSLLFVVASWLYMYLLLSTV